MTKNSPSIHLALLFLRVVSGLMMLFGHGWSKLLKVMSGDFAFVKIMGMPPALGLILAVIVEVGAAALLIVGFKSRIMAALLFLTMLSAILFYHTTDPLFVASAGGGGSKELAIMYAVIFLALTLTGGGKYSIKER